MVIGESNETQQSKPMIFKINSLMIWYHSWRESPVGQAKNIIDNIAVGVDAEVVDTNTEEVHPKAAFYLQEEAMMRRTSELLDWLVS